jgi:hypothetical protein
MKFENVAKVGDRIRGYDFMGIKDHFIEGVVVAKGWIKHPVTGMELYKGYTIKIDRDGVDNTGDRVGDDGYIPFESTFDYDSRVELV